MVLKNEHKPEVLAPVGSSESLEAAVRAGADAVYLGLGSFNARRNAANFSEAELMGAVEYCHIRGVKVYVTLNTLIGDDELDDALKCAQTACRAGADALIVQDLGLARLIRRAAPLMPLHASTQMSVHTVGGVRALKALGYSRVCLAREMSRKEIAEVCAEPGMEYELFVHGAHCMSVSGKCYLSAVLGGRGGNRGLCAQPCRLPFGVEGGTGRDLSLKDISLVDRIGEIADMGVCSLKIEGRMKRPEYVAAAVTACRQAVDCGGVSDETRQVLRGVFSRSGFTSGYYDGKISRDMFGTRQKDDIADRSLINAIHGLYRAERQGVGLDMELTVKRGEAVSLTVSDGVNTETVRDEAPQNAENAPLSEERAASALGKTGGTPYFLRGLVCHIDDGVTLPISRLNGLRRQALEAVGSKRRGGSVPFAMPVTAKTARRRGKGLLAASFLSVESMPNDLSGVCRAFVPIEEFARCGDELVSRYGTDKIGVDIPAGLFGREAELEKMLDRAAASGVKWAVVQGIGEVRAVKERGMKAFCGWGLNVFNTESAKCAEELGADTVTASFELKLGAAARIDCRSLCVIGYGSLPLMLMRACPARNGATCRECGKNSVVTDRMGVRFPLKCRMGCTQLLNSRPLWLADKTEALDFADYIMLNFTTEDKNECARVIAAYKNGGEPPTEYTRGLYFRGVK